ncbi:Glycosyltransferase involved in cell wall bisynthesis [Faunimonas pinastri]|uniref:Glycosyltransferase involved in cell wall bisynthesis n=1 Tax=Faunimonas pinastri TaxID=1855383 RepID=A0A1H9JXI9_9HYPH|nr:glycosyltransferase family 4 protein [Faunimonas pinastri]SEQ91532.1 Glycosyltransferase involved in cell wall bisynthesis [Faunimonas pinastri]
MTSEPRRILMTTDSVGGVWTYSLDLCRELSRRNIDVTLVVMGGKPNREQMRDAEFLSNVSLIATDLKLEWMQGAEDDLRIADELLIELEAERQPDIVHLNGYHHAALPFQAPVLAVAHSCVTSWFRACRAEPVPAEWERYEHRVGECVRAADMIVAPTHSYYRTFTELHGQPRAGRVILNGRDPNRFDPRRQKHPVALGSGRLWDEAKNISLLCKAAEGLPYPVAIAGTACPPGSNRAELQPNVTELGFLPPPDLAGHMARSSVYVAPARYEPFGLGVLEAALSACALIVADIGTLRELWDGAAVFVSPDDAAGLHNALRALLDDPRRCEELGTLALERGRHFTAERMAEGYLDAYRTLLGGSHPHVGMPARTQGARL